MTNNKIALPRLDYRTLSVGKTYEGYLFIKDMRSFKAKKSKVSYLIVTMTDGLTEINGFSTKLRDKDLLSNGDLVFIKAEVVKYYGIVQLKIKKIIKHTCNQCPDVRIQPRKLLLKADKLVNEIKNPLIKFIVEEETIFDVDFTEAPASISAHHGYRHGLLEHSVEVLDIALKTAKVGLYNKDLLIAGSLLHDVGKKEQYTFLNGIPIKKDMEIYKGHIDLGYDILEKYKDKSNEKIIKLLQKLIVNHHGSKTNIKLRESYIINKADTTSTMNNRIKNYSYRESNTSGKVVLVGNDVVYSKKYIDELLYNK